MIVTSVTRVNITFLGVFLAYLWTIKTSRDLARPINDAVNSSLQQQTIRYDEMAKSNYETLYNYE